MNDGEVKKDDKAYSIKYDNYLDAMVLNVYEPEKIFPLYMHVDNVGLYRIIKNKTGKIQMTK